MKYILDGCLDADYAGNMDARKYLLGFVFILFGTYISWKKINNRKSFHPQLEWSKFVQVEEVKEHIWLRGVNEEL